MELGDLALKLAALTPANVPFPGTSFQGGVGHCDCGFKGISGFHYHFQGTRSSVVGSYNV